MVQIVKQKAFERAIAGDDRDASNPVPSFEDISIEDSYPGPKLADDGKPTRQFMLDLEKTFKDQKKLHKRYILQMLKVAMEQFQKQPTLVDLTVPDNG